jgi:hypothetical protein
MPTLSITYESYLVLSIEEDGMRDVMNRDGKYEKPQGRDKYQVRTAQRPGRLFKG